MLELAETIIHMLVIFGAVLYVMVVVSLWSLR